MTTVKETLLSTLDWKHTFEGKPRSRRFWQCKLTEGTMIILNYFKKTQKTKTKWEQTNASLLHRCFNNHGSRERVETKGNQWHEQLSWPLLPPTLFSGTFLGPFCRKIHVFFLSFQSFLKKVWQIQQFFSWQKWKKTYPRSSKQQKQIKHLSDYCHTFVFFCAETRELILKNNVPRVFSEKRTLNSILELFLHIKPKLSGKFGKFFSKLSKFQLFVWTVWQPF